VLIAILALAGMAVSAVSLQRHYANRRRHFATLERDLIATL